MALHTAQGIARVQIDQTVTKALITPTQWRIDLVLSSVLVMLRLRKAGMRHQTGYMNARHSHLHPATTQRSLHRVAALPS